MGTIRVVKLTLPTDMNDPGYNDMILYDMKDHIRLSPVATMSDPHPAHKKRGRERRSEQGSKKARNKE